MAEDKKIERRITTEHKQPSSINESNNKQSCVRLHREGGKIEKRSNHSNVINESAGPSGSRKK